MEKSHRLLVVLAAILLLLVAAIVGLDPPKEDAEETDDPEARFEAVFSGLSGEQVERLEVEQGEARYVLERAEGAWRIVEPFRAEADATSVEAMVDSFATVQAGPALTGEPPEYGLAPPTARLKLRTAAGAQHELWIGRDAPVGNHSYLAAGPGQPARVSRTRLSTLLRTQVDELRSPELWRWAQAELSALRLESPAARLLLEKREGDWWIQAALAAPGTEGPPELEKPARRADRARVEALLRRLSRMRAAGFVHAPAFHPEALPWSLQAEAAGLRQELRAGQTDDGSWVASAPRQEGLVTLDPDWAEPLLIPVTEWWAVDLLNVERGRVKDLELRLGERRLLASRSAAGFSPPEADGVLAAISEVRVERRPVAEPTGEPWGWVRLVDEAGQERRVDLFQELPEGGRVAREVAGGPPFPLHRLELDRLQAALP